MTFRTLLALVILLVGCVEATAEQEDPVVRQFENATIISVARPDYVSGIVAAWAVLTADTPDQKAVKFHIRYMSANQAFPAVNSRCSIDAREEFIQGVSANGAIDLDQPLLVPYFMECDGVIYEY